jgi:glycolate oxidase iron-sulfur subunit
MAKISEDKAKALLRCNKCGFCQAHCPIYKVTGLESNTARGRITIIRSALLENQLDIKELEDPVYNCLTCNACNDDCPAGVQTSEIIFNTREDIHRPSWLSKMVFQNVLADPSQLHRASGLLRFADVTGLHNAARKTGIVNLIGDAGKAEAMVPRAPSGTGLINLRKINRKIDNPKYRVAYFVGCFASNLAPEEANATVKVLNRHGAEVIIPDFSCCGIPAPAYGEKSSARTLAKKNIEIASKLNVDAIVTPCASCSSFLKEYGKLLADDAEWAGRAKEFSAKVRDLSEFLVGVGLVNEMKTIKKRVTYHDPCHLVRYQKIKQPQRTILKSIPGVEFVELKEADMCCGAAGSYAFKNYDLSMKVLERKINNVEKANPDILVSSCPACLMQLTSGVKNRNLTVRTVSVIELLNEALSEEQ